MTESPASLASWMAIEPTPPAPPMMSRDRSRWASFPSIPKRPNTACHAVIVVKGSPAASSRDSVRGLRATIRSSTIRRPVLYLPCLSEFALMCRMARLATCIEGSPSQSASHYRARRSQSRIH